MAQTKTEKAFQHLQQSMDRIRAKLDRDIAAAVKKFERGVKDCPAKNGFAFTPPQASVTMPKLYTV